FFVLSISQYNNINNSVQKPALNKHQGGVAYILDILNQGRRKYPDANSNAVKIMPSKKRILSGFFFASSKNIKVTTIPHNTIEVCAAFPLWALIQCSQADSLITASVPIA